MVSMVFADKRPGQESKDYFRASQTDQAHELLQRSPVPPVRQRLQDVLRSRILATEKPNICNSQRGQRIPRFDLPDIAQRRGLLSTRFVRTAAAARAKHDRHAFVLVQRPREVRSSRALIVWMRDHQQNIHFVALVRRRKRLWPLRPTRKHRPKKKGAK